MFHVNKRNLLLIAGVVFCRNYICYTDLLEKEI